jgi:hypothetical protein
MLHLFELRCRVGAAVFGGGMHLAAHGRQVGHLALHGLLGKGGAAGQGQGDGRQGDTGLFEHRQFNLQRGEGWGLHAWRSRCLRGAEHYARIIVIGL